MRRSRGKRAGCLVAEDAQLTAAVFARAESRRRNHVHGAAIATAGEGRAQPSISALRSRLHRLTGLDSLLEHLNLVAARGVEAQNYNGYVSAELREVFRRVALPRRLAAARIEFHGVPIFRSRKPPRAACAHSCAGQAFA